MSAPDETESRSSEPFEATSEMKRRNLLTALIIVGLVLVMAIISMLRTVQPPT